MTRPQRYLTRIALFLVAVIAAAAMLGENLVAAFTANALLNGLIVGVLLIGIIYILRQFLSLRSEVEWLETLRKREPGSVTPEPPTLLAPMASMIGEAGVVSLSEMSLRSILDSISARLDESRDLSRYMIGLLVFLGLLGTFWGLLITIGAIADTVETLRIGDGDFAAMFEELKAGLQRPLGGMGTAFSSSLFGLAGSLVLGFLDLQASQAQNRFYNELEEWLSGLTQLSRGAPGGLVAEAGAGVPTYVSALLEQTAESIKELQMTLARDQDGRSAANQAVTTLAERIAELTDQLASDRGGIDDASRNHLRNADMHLQALLQESRDGRTQLLQELKAELNLMTRSVAALTDSLRGREGD